MNVEPMLPELVPGFRTIGYVGIFGVCCASAETISENPAGCSFARPGMQKTPELVESTCVLKRMCVSQL